MANLRMNPGQLAPPAMPGARTESPEQVAVRTAGQHLESARREVAVKAETAARFYNAWKTSRARLGPKGDPALWRTVEAEVMLFRRAADALVRPAVKFYAEALRRAIVAGKGPAENLMAKLLEADATAQSLGYTSTSLLSQGEWRKILDTACTKAGGLLRAEQNTRTLGFAVFCHSLAAAFDATDVPSVKALDAQLTTMVKGQ